MGVIDLFRLDGKVALVTGGGTGLGRGMAMALAEAGADVVVAGRKPEVICDTAEQIRGKGRRALALGVNLLESAGIGPLVDRIVAEFGRLDIVVNNAGMTRRLGVLEFTEADWDDVINVNQRSVFLLAQAAARVMAAQGGGKIINIASMLSFQGGIRTAAYTASKHAVVGITKVMANELAAQNIQVNAIAPGYMATDLTAPLQADQQRNPEILGRIPAGRWGTPADLAGAVVFLASSASDYVTGHVLAVDGGWLAR